MDLCEPESTLGLAGTGAGSALATNSGLPQHPAEGRPERPVPWQEIRSPVER